MAQGPLRPRHAPARPRGHPPRPLVSAATRYVAVCGPGEAADDELACAEAVGAELAQAGAVVVCGGLGGVMEAACRGAASAGGVTVGLLPGADRAAGNAFL